MKVPRHAIPVLVETEGSSYRPRSRQSIVQRPHSTIPMDIGWNSGLYCKSLSPWRSWRRRNVVPFGKLSSVLRKPSPRGEAARWRARGTTGIRKEETSSIDDSCKHRQQTPHFCSLWVYYSLGISFHPPRAKFWICELDSHNESAKLLLWSPEDSQPRVVSEIRNFIPRISLESVS